MKVGHFAWTMVYEIPVWRLPLLKSAGVHLLRAQAHI